MIKPWEERCTDKVNVQEAMAAEIAEHRTAAAATQDPIGYFDVAVSEGVGSILYSYKAQPLKSGTPLYAAPIPSKFNILAITTAYEQGVGKGRQRREVNNPYADEPCKEAWKLGYQEGLSMLPLCEHAL